MEDINNPTVVIPTYWAREFSHEWREGDAVYDHPTPVDKDGTLGGLLKSMSILKGPPFDIVILAVPTTRDIQADVEKKVKEIASASLRDTDIDPIIIGPSKLALINRFLNSAGKGEFADILKLRGYSNVRNMCLFATHLLGSPAAILVDDDQVFEDPYFISKSLEFLGEGRVYGVGGYYVQPEGGYLIHKEASPWMELWDQTARMNEAFKLYIGQGERLKKTPFVFGGNMVIHKKLFSQIPFDPAVTRGEDIDYLINSRLFGYDFYLDNELSIRHLPPGKSHPTWMQLREDIIRFIYERSKISGQSKLKGCKTVAPDDLDPYPGAFLKDDLESKIEGACRLLSKEYLDKGDREGSREALKNIGIARDKMSSSVNALDNLIDFKERWSALMTYADTDRARDALKRIIST